MTKNTIVPGEETMGKSATAAELIAEARSITGLEHFDSESFVEGLTILLEEMGSAYHPGLMPVPRALMVSALANRLRTTAYLDAHPELLQRPVERPVFVFGIPRTGTTLLSNLLAADPNRRSPLSWEIDDPVPPAKADALLTDERAIQRLREHEARLEADPASGRLYRASPIYPNECIFFMHSDFKAMIWESMGRLPVYRDWMFSVDMTPAYQYHRRFLQLLQSEAPGIWNLKMPSHALWLDTLLSIYPDARLVWTHRDPVQATGSFCSLIENSQEMFLGEADIDWVSQDMPWQAVEHARRATEFSERNPGRVIDVHYADMIRDPIEAMKRLYAALGDPFTAEAEAGMRAWLADNPQGKFGQHEYKLEKFGLKADRLRDDFGDYLARYNVEPEGF